TAVSESDLTKLAEQWEACKTPGGQFVYTSESELPVPYQAGHRLTIHAAEVPAPDSDMRDAPPVHRISRTDAPPRLAMADFVATTTPFAAPFGDGGKANRADQRKPSRKWQ